MKKSSPTLVSALVGTLVGALAACSTVPDASWPPALSGELEAVYRFGEGTPRIFRVPASDDELTVLWLEADPPMVTEQFIDGERIWIAPPHLDVLHVRFGYRIWGHRGDGDPFGASSPIENRFPGAVIVRHDAAQE